MENFPQIEQRILAFWQKNGIIEKSLKNRRGRKRFVFYDGPPFANGLPHYGHLLVLSIKDAFLRYKTLQGFYVPRKNGWDCHGLPVEYEIEKELKISGKKSIVEFGIEKFNQRARQSVFRYKDIWEKTILRLGQSVDFKESFATLDFSYIESVWWTFKALFEKKLVYRDLSVSAYCPRCQTTLSNFETTQGYKDTEDPSVLVKFKIKNPQKISLPSQSFFIVWTTTPWTLPSNTALAFRPDMNYWAIAGDNTGKSVFILAKDACGRLGITGKKIKAFKGKELAGLKYEPLFKIKENAQCATVLADFVATDEGTGIVHIAPAYGEEDLALAKKIHLPLVDLLDEAGKFKPNAVFGGVFFKQADSLVLEKLEKQGSILRSGRALHSYPFCWRCETPLIYRATPSWFLRVSNLKRQLLAANKKINWQPPYLKDGRFGKWLVGAKDWNLSRQRFWGAPIPIWSCQKCGAQKVVGSFSELTKLSSQKINTGSKNFDPHRPFIDAIEFNCPDCSGKMRRVEDVFDCWFESGAMPYAQWHYPFENKKLFEENFPADFIAEALDQTRGWFYTLHILSVGLFNKPAFLNAVVNGFVLDAQGRKLSKRLRNYPEPDQIFSTIGADSLRQYLYSSAPLGEDYRFSEELVREETRKTLLPFLNSLRFLEIKSNGKLKKSDIVLPVHILDKWFLGKLALAVAQIEKLMDGYKLTPASRHLKKLIADFSNWYLRRSRTRQDREFLSNLNLFLKNIAIISSPFMPFVSEEIYQKTKLSKDPESVHLTDWPKFSAKSIDPDLVSQMDDLKELVELGHGLRKKREVPVRQPLPLLAYELSGNTKLPGELEELLLDELNIKKIADQGQLSSHTLLSEIKNKKIFVDFAIGDELLIEGKVRELCRQIQSLRKKAGLQSHQKAFLRLETSQSFGQIIDLHRHKIEEKTRTKFLKKATYLPKAEGEIKIKDETLKIYLYV